MLYVFYQLFIAFCLLFISICGMLIAVSMWQKSKTICDECKDKIDA